MIQSQLLSRKFFSAENFVPGPILSEKIDPFLNDFFEKMADPENLLKY